MKFSVRHAWHANTRTSASLPLALCNLLVHHPITATAGKRQGQQSRHIPSGQLLAQLEEDFKAECHATMHTNTPGMRGLKATSATRTSPVVKLPTDATLAVPLDALGNQYLSHIDRQLGPFPAALMDLLTGACVLLHVQFSDLTCLLTFDDQEVAQLQDSELKSEAKQQRAWAIGLHEAWLAPLGLAPALSESLWALAQTRSRSFEFGLRSGVRVFLTAPFLDLANHSHKGSNCEAVLEERNRRLILQPTRLISAREEILINYSGGGAGSSNLDLLANYGFIQPGNLYDVVPLVTSRMQLHDLPPIDLLSVRAAADYLIARLEAARSQKDRQAFPADNRISPATARIRCALNSLQAAAALQQQHLQAHAEFRSPKRSGDWRVPWLCQVDKIMNAKDGLGATTMKQDAALLLRKPHQLEEGSSGGKHHNQELVHGMDREGEVFYNRFAGDKNVGARRNQVIVNARLERKALYAHVANILKAARPS
ncbi:hypothetical protein DUNSADRAFT_8335 [Dunaliella salina]|uniref:SET domain-containing protein n=1 Tax=Dunaliella salina TaxID=3046 RepID=A0ABQ7H600_DUNSA|nr:hypothetical protein DUNSADRAFT_8335 [Dunaliella salina]|eukprot:KAF5842272.1 hypothetical protein DUNSADRAFT_8335 [Dunaliella salina]